MRSHDRQAIRERWKGTTPEPWTRRTLPPLNLVGFVQGPPQAGDAYGTEILGDEEYATKNQDIEAIAHAPSDIRQLLDELDRVLAATQKLRCLMVGTECLHMRTEDEGCRCSNCTIFREVWDG